jgi:hypothetical protein
MECAVVYEFRVNWWMCWSVKFVDGRWWLPARECVWTLQMVQLFLENTVCTANWGTFCCRTPVKMAMSFVYPIPPRLSDSSYQELLEVDDRPVWQHLWTHYLWDACEGGMHVKGQARLVGSGHVYEEQRRQGRAPQRMQLRDRWGALTS